MIRVLIADDHLILREGLKMILDDAEDIRVAGEATDGEEVLDKLNADHFDVLVMDINMPKKTGFEVLAALKARGTKTPVLILSTYSGDECRENAIKNGASGYLTKEQAPEKLVAAIRKLFRDFRMPA